MQFTPNKYFPIDTPWHKLHTRSSLCSLYCLVVITVKSKQEMFPAKNLPQLLIGCEAESKQLTGR